VKNLENLYGSLPGPSDDISSTESRRVQLRVPADPEVVEVVSGIYSNPMSNVHTMPLTSLIEQSRTECTARSDHQIDENNGASPFSSTVLSIHCPEGESEVEHIGSDEIAQEKPTVHLDDVTQTEVPTEAMDSESEEPDLSSAVNMDSLCATTVAFGHSILASAVGKQRRNRCLISCLHRIFLMMAKFLIIYRISKRDINHMVL
jgi:hypothetical protein